MIRAHKVALVPTSRQALLLSRTCGYARKAYNLALTDFKAGLAEGVWRTVPELKRRLNATKYDVLPWSRELNQNASKNSVMDLGKGIENWKRDRKKPKKQRRSHFPKFHKRGVRDSYRASNGPDTVPVEGKMVKLPKVGMVSMREALRFGGKVVCATVSRPFDELRGESLVCIHQRRGRPAGACVRKPSVQGRCRSGRQELGDGGKP